MKRILTLCALSIQLILQSYSSSAAPQQPKQVRQQTGTNRLQNDREWRAGTYLGLAIGKSYRTDVVRLLGEPKRVDRPTGQTQEDENLEIWYVYDSRNPFRGDLTVVIDERTDVVLGINLNPHNLTKSEAVKHFGPDFILTRYAFDDCLGNEESAPLYESPSGPVLEVEYRHRGIALSVTHDGKINTISYVSKPVGMPKSKCASSAKRLPERK
ncbi:MAG TPA: hypothetical protein VFS76_26120 [Pyrinomonadaceae bacterium]|nr:hypothetical protein [Pyrinomonadaceae bacterium]